ncbi:MAG: ABC transporter substrate-binding protein [Clostridium sp.]|nr:ABC transporter substrate-binding protein [Clostridium sp.]
MKITLGRFCGMLIALALAGCGKRQADLSDYSVNLYEPSYAGGFEIKTAPGAQSSIIVCHSPWQGSGEGDATMLFISRGGEKAPEGFEGQVLDGDAKRIVCMSSTHIAMLDAIDEIDRVAAVSGKAYITNDRITNNADIPDIGYEGNIDYETLVAIDPDLVLLYGVNGANSMEGKLRELGIPFAYIGEYLEEHPLGKAEWMVAIGEMAGQRDEGAERFGAIAPEYCRLKEMADTFSVRPRVMINTPYADSWVMAPPTSYVATLIADAGGEYAYSKSESNASMPIDLEEAYLLADQSDYWINVGQFTSMSDLAKALPKFADTKPMREGNVWNATLRATEGGGNDYWESGVANPELVLTDLIKIFHPEALDSLPFTYYQRLR